MVTIKDVAKEAGVAISTVSNVLNNVNIVSEETRQKVLDASNRLKYVPNINAKLLKTNKRNTIGLFVPSVQGEFYKIIMQAIHIQCKLNGYLLNIYVSNENTSEEIYSMVISSGVVGAIIINEKLEDEHLSRIEESKLPVVFVDREYTGEKMSSVLIDNVYGANLAVEYLAKHGHKRIGYIHGVYNTDDEGRYKGYEDAMNKYKLPIDKNIILRGFFEEMVAYSEMRVLLLKGIDLPDAMFCANDEMAIGCIRALTEAGIDVPSQISVVGFDDIPMASIHNPPLTTIHSPVLEMGTLCFNELIRLLSEEDDDLGVGGLISRLVPSLVVRDTCEFRI